MLPQTQSRGAATAASLVVAGALALVLSGCAEQVVAHMPGASTATGQPPRATASPTAAEQVTGNRFAGRAADELPPGKSPRDLVATSPAPAATAPPKVVTQAPTQGPKPTKAAAPPATPVQPAPPAAPAPVADPCPPSKAWKLDLDEHFTSLNPKVWNVKDATYADNEASYLRARNVTVSRGALRIQAKKESHGGRQYTSGYVETMGKYTVPTHFRAEVRARVPMEQGMWPAPLWFRPVDGQAGEIDLVETYGKDAVAGRASFHQTIHTEYGDSHRQKALSKKFSEHSSKAPTDWHTYTVEKTAGKIVMYVDCVKTAQFTAGDPTWFSHYYDKGDRWNLRVNLQVGGEWGGSPDSRTNWAADRTAMEIDHIKTWVPAS